MWAEPATIKVVKPWKWLIKPWNVVQTRYNRRSPEILQIWHSWLVQWTQRYQPTKRREGPLFGDLKTDHPGPRYAPMPMLSWSFLRVLSLPTQYFFGSCSCHYITMIFPFNSHCIHNKSQKISLNHHQIILQSPLNHLWITLKSPVTLQSASGFSPVIFGWTSSHTSAQTVGVFYDLDVGPLQNELRSTSLDYEFLRLGGRRV